MSTDIGQPAVCQPCPGIDHAALVEEIACGAADLHAELYADPALKGAPRIDLDKLRESVNKALPYLLSAYGVFGGLVPANAKPFTDFAIDAVVRLLKVADGQAQPAAG